jgi:hypothetical protein
MTAIRGSCLCGDVAWETTGPLEFMSHCHCSRCRKSHGSAFATYVVVTPDAFRLVRGGERIARYESSPGLSRPFCSRCGSPVADGEASQGLVGVPAGPLDDDPGVRPLAHIFASSKAPWFEIAGDLPRFDGFPPGFNAPQLPELAPRDAATGRARGSCLCGAVAYVIEGDPFRSWNCHCSRCRKARGAAYASNLFAAADDVRFTRGEDHLVTFKLPEARYFTQTFCRSCGSPMPRIARERGFAIVPMGSLDDDPGMPPSRHIFAASKAPWYDIPDQLPQDPEFPSSL